MSEETDAQKQFKIQKGIRQTEDDLVILIKNSSKPS